MVRKICHVNFTSLHTVNKSNPTSAHIFLSVLLKKAVNSSDYTASVVECVSTEHKQNDNEEKQSTHRKSCPKASKPTRNPTFTGLGSNMGFWSQWLVATCLNQGITKYMLP
jgi:hypothetical protein